MYGWLGGGAGQRDARRPVGLGEGEDLDSTGVAFRSATEPFDTTTPAGRMIVQMLGVFAKFERPTIIDRVIAGMERKATKGAWTVDSHRSRSHRIRTAGQP